MVKALIDGIKNKLNIAAKPEFAAKIPDTAEAQAITKTKPSSRSTSAGVSKPEKIIQQLKVGPHTFIENTEDVESHSAKKLLKFYEHDKELKAKNNADAMAQVTAVFSQDKKEMLIHLPSEIASAKLTNTSILKKLTSLFSSFKVNDALTRLKDGDEIDLISEQNEPTDIKLLQKLTKAGVYSFIAIHKTNEKGDFPAKADLLIPVMNLHAMLEYLKSNPPKGIDKNFHDAFKAEIAELELNPNLKGFNFIDEALALKTNKGQYETPEELRKALCSAADLLTLDKKTQVFVSSDLIAKGEEAQTNDGKHIHAINYQYPVIGTDGSVSIVEHPLSLYRHESLKNTPIPKEIPRLLQWHFMAQLKDPRTIDKKPESLQAMQKSFEFDTNAILAFDQNLTNAEANANTQKKTS